MKLRNKKTGKVIEWSNNTDGVFPNTLAELNRDWEDYEEPKGCWIINIFGIVEYTHFRNEAEVELLKQIGNYFETEEEAEKAVEKHKAWTRLEDKGFRFIGKTYETDKRFGSIFYKLHEDTYSEDIVDDLDLLFGGEE